MDYGRFRDTWICEAGSCFVFPAEFRMGLWEELPIRLGDGVRRVPPFVRTVE